MTKANFNIPAEEWKAFGLKVMQKEGSQKKGMVVRKLVNAYTKGTIIV